MTAAATPINSVGPVPGRFTRFRFGPSEGWLSVVLVGIMGVALAWSIDDPAWVLGRDRLTDFLAPMALLGVAAGFIGAKVGWSRWQTHLVGAIFAALIVPLVTGWLMGPAGGLPDILYRRTAEAVVNAWLDLAIRGRALTSEYGHYLLVLGLITWGTAQYAAYAVFGHRRPLDAVVVVGIVLLGNMSLTFHDQLHLLILYSLAALFLLIRSHTFEERTTWLRRRIGDPAAMSSLYQRGGTVFIGLAVLGALTLTASASSAPLQGLWAGVPQKIVEIGQALQRFLPTGGGNRTVGTVGFSETAQVQGVWASDDRISLTIDVPIGETRKFYWRAAAYQQFDQRAWSLGANRLVAVGANAAVLQDQADDPTATTGRREIRVTLHPDAFQQGLILSPQAIVSVDRPSNLKVVGRTGFFSELEMTGQPGTYSIVALVPDYGDADPGDLTKNKLRAAGTDYPAEIRSFFLGVPAGSLGPDARKLLDTFRSTITATDPYDVAEALRDYLRDADNFTYDTDVTDLPDCEQISTVECFARWRRGYCQYYASTMAILLRQMNIPTRFVQGFLPGSRDARGVETIRNLQAHAWVEVYFPKYGWVDFDPTGGGIPQDTEIPSGAPVPTGTPRPSSSLGLVTDRPEIGDDPSRRPTQVGGGTTTGGPGPGPYIAIAILLAIAIGALAFAAWQRGPRGDVDPERVWRGIARLAARFGFGPRPAETVYEYAGTLGDILPSARPELQTVARAKVEVAYGRQTLAGDQMRGLRDANRRLRVLLLRLAIRRPGRPRRRS